MAAFLAAGIKVDAQESVFIPTPGQPVHYNWGSGSPSPGLPADKFTATFDQSQFYVSGDYFIQARADDGVKVEVDNQFLIDRWSNSPVLVTDRALWTGVQGGQHTVKTHYYEDGGNASVFSDVVPFDSWLAYYYPNESMSGAPTAAKVIEPVGELKKLSENNGSGTPIKGINSDHFSASYTSAKRIPAGEYILRAKADDGVRVYVDGKLVLDRWTPAPILTENAVKIQVSDRADAKAGEKDVHWVEVEYYEGTGNSQVDFSLEPFQKAIEDTWVAEYFPNMTLQGNPFVETGITQSGLNFNWKTGSPHSSIPSDAFSTRFTKSIDFQDGIYEFGVRADDGVRLWVDNQLVIDSWVSSSGELKTGRISLDKGRHTVKVEYFEGNGLANLSMTYQPFVTMPPQIGGEVHYNWGSGSPGLGIPADKFTALFDQSKNFTSGDYFIQALADDGIKMEVDGQWLINRWNNSPVLVTDRALWTGVQAGQHTVKTHYYEDGGNASVFSDVVPFDSWLAYYYPNENMAGAPTAAKVIEPVGELKKLSESHGAGNPIKGINSDHFSARYTTAKRISAGEYILRAKADDGIRVYVDGNLVLDRWAPAPILKENAVKIQVSDRADAKVGEKDVHWIEVEYYEGTGNSQIDFFLEPFQKAIEDTWVAEYYPNTILQGNPYVEGGVNSTTKLSTINFDWKAGSPELSLPADQFSARFTKKMNLEAGTYLFDVVADDGIRVKVDNNIIIDSWNNRDVTSPKKGVAYVNSGYHTIEVEYYEGSGNANVSVDYKQISPNRLFYSANPEVDYYWGSGSPSTFPADNFEAIFNQSQYLSGGDYFLETISDDGVQVEVDGQTKIDMWNSSAGNLNQALLLNQKPGEHSILTRYYEATGLAFVYSHLVKFDDWIAYYYPNSSLSGVPTAAKVIPASGTNKALSELNSNNSPVPGSISPDNFSAVYRTAKKLDAGEYVIRGRADDGIRVYIDGNLVLDRWTPGGFTEDAVKVSIQDNNTVDPSQKNVHWIQVEYFEGNGSNNLEFFIQPYNDVINTNQWVGFLYPNKNLTGTPMILGGTGAQTPITDLNFNWGAGTPHAKIPSDGFSARFVKKEYFNTGKYQIKTYSDDGIRVYVDGSLKIDSWVDSGNDYKDAFINLNAGVHEIVVEYYENVAGANLNVDIDQVNATSYLEIDLRTRSNITVDEIRAFFDRKGHSNNPLKAHAQEFINAQEKYGVNAQYLVAHAIWETGWANPKLSSLMSYKNNLFGYGAYDSCPFTCGYYFPSGEESIFHEAYIVRKNYLEEDGMYYNGPTLPGMNVRYATDNNWANGISNLMQQMKPLDGSYYLHNNILPGSPVALPTYGRDIPAGLPYPTNIVINYPTDTWATVITNGLTLRSIPYTSTSTAIGTLTSGTVVKVLGYNTDVRYQQAYPYDQRWYRVLVNGKEGWLYGGGLGF
ncbi:PA14 domain-containing protein [Neobacillus niacini]|uniref:PA14 domain-containing protein n=1 Tax=Neobacillus niacini TaxID=86668 RepID=UPI002FFF1376